MRFFYSHRTFLQLTSNIHQHCVSTSRHAPRMSVAPRPPSRSAAYRLAQRRRSPPRSRRDRRRSARRSPSLSSAGEGAAQAAVGTVGTVVATAAAVAVDGGEEPIVLRRPHMCCGDGGGDWLGRKPTRPLPLGRRRLGRVARPSRPQPALVRDATARSSLCVLLMGQPHATEHGILIICT